MPAKYIFIIPNRMSGPYSIDIVLDYSKFKSWFDDAKISRYNLQLLWEQKTGTIETNFHERHRLFKLDVEEFCKTSVRPEYQYEDQKKFIDDFLAFVGEGKIRQDAIYCPGDIRAEIDPEMAFGMNGAIDSLNLYKIPFWGNGKRLKNLSRKSKLYIVAHGGSVTESVITTKSGGKWSAQQLATLLEKDGLRKGHFCIELLCCHAGESVNTFKGQEKAKKVAKKINKAKASLTHEAFEEKYTKEKKRQMLDKAGVPRSSNYTGDKNQVLPFGAQLSDELKLKGYKNIMVVSYAAAVSFDFSNGIKFITNTHMPKSQWNGVYAKDCPNLRIVW